MKIAYLVLAHRNIDQLYKLLDILIAHTDNHVFVHLDSKFNPQIDDKYLNINRITFLGNRINISWGGFSVIAATQLLLKEAYSQSDFDYYILLSGQCLPIKSQNEIRGYLKINNGFSFLEATNKINRDDESYLYKFYYPVFFDALNFIKFDRIKIGRKRPYVKKLLISWVRKLYKLLRLRRKVPVGIEPHFGSQWWVLHREHVKYIFEFINKRPEIVNYFKYTWAPDELFYQSVLMSSPIKDSIINRFLWYIDWSANGPPKTLTMDDWEKLEKSDKLFARKFDITVDREIIEKVRKRLCDLAKGRRDERMKEK